MPHITNAFQTPLSSIIDNIYINGNPKIKCTIKTGNKYPIDNSSTKRDIIVDKPA